MMEQVTALADGGPFKLIQVVIPLILSTLQHRKLACISTDGC